MPYLRRTRSITSYVSSFRRPVSSVNTRTFGSIFTARSISAASSAPNDEAIAIFLKCENAHFNKTSGESWACAALSPAISDGAGEFTVDRVQDNAPAQNLLFACQDKAPGGGYSFEF